MRVCEGSYLRSSDDIVICDMCPCMDKAPPFPTGLDDGLVIASQRSKMLVAHPNCHDTMNNAVATIQRLFAVGMGIRAGQIERRSGNETDWLRGGVLSLKSHIVLGFTMHCHTDG